jgi:DNA-damage-inducible protein D
VPLADSDSNPLAKAVPSRAVAGIVRWGTYAMAEIDLFHFDDDRPNFEAYGRENGFRHWLASDLMRLLEYAGIAPIRRAVQKAIAACAALGVPIQENFKETTTEGIGADWRLSRFACYLTVMNGDPKNPRVASAQAYFITVAEAFRQYVQEAEGVERVLVRSEVSERETALSATVHIHGVIHFAFFQNAGYRGMYNLDLKQIRRLKRIPEGRSPLDFMGKTELAANLFRITQTEEKIINEDIRGQYPLEQAAAHVGREVRATMERISGTKPEHLPPAQDIREVRIGLKKAGKEFAKIDHQRSNDE